MSISSSRGRGRRAFLFLVASVFFVTSGTLVAGHAQAQSVSLSTASVSLPLPPPIGPCIGGFSPAGDIFDAVQSLPMGPPGCGLGWPGPAALANVDAFCSGASVFFFGPLPLPIPAGFLTLQFSVDKLATGDTTSTCATASPGLLAPDVGSESCGLFLGNNANNQSTDAADDIFSSALNAAPLGIGPIPGSMLPQWQLADGDGLRSFPCPFPPAPGTARIEPTFPAGPAPGNQPIDDVDAYDFEGPASGIIPFDVAPADGIGDRPLYYSVDPPTAAASGFLPADVLVSLGGVAFIYAPAGLLALGPLDDIDGLVVNDVALDGVYAPFPGPDRILYSLSSASPAIGALDCMGFSINAGDILTEGTPLGFPGVPCIIIDSISYGLWKGAFCGPNPVTAAVGGDNLDGFDIVPPFVAPPALVCGSAPELDGSCYLADVSGLGKSALSITNVGTPGKKNKFSWKWQKGVATAAFNFQDPVSLSSKYRLCIYDTSGSAQPILQKDLSPNAVVPLCSGKPCWKANGSPPKGFKYKNSKQPRLSGGVIGLTFKAGDAGKSKLSVKAKERYSDPPSTAPIVAPVIVQMLVTDGFTTECFKTTFPVAGIKKQTLSQFLIKGP